MVYDDFPSKTWSPQGIISLVFATGDFFLTVSNVSCVNRGLKVGKPIQSEATTPSRPVLIPRGVTEAEHRDSSTSSAPSPSFLCLWFLFWLQAETVAPWISSPFIYPSVQWLTQSFNISPHFSCSLQSLLSFSMKEKYVLDLISGGWRESMKYVKVP